METRVVQTSSGENQLAKELMSLVSDYNYCDTIRKIDPVGCIIPPAWKMMSLSEEFWVDTSYCYTDRNLRNSNCLLDMFGRYSGESADDVRKDIVDSMWEERAFFEQVGQCYLRAIKLSLEDWIKDMRDTNSPCDELLLYALSRRYNRHVVVQTTDSIWSTVQGYETMPLNVLLDACHLRLAYVSVGLFGIIRKKGLYATYSKTNSTKKPEVPRRGRPRKPRPDPHGYRKFDYCEDLTSNTLSIPVDKTDQDYISELASRAQEIKNSCVTSCINELTEQGINVTGLSMQDRLSITSTKPGLATSTSATTSRLSITPTNCDRLSTTMDEDDRLLGTDSCDNSDFSNLHPEAKPLDVSDHDRDIDNKVESSTYTETHTQVQDYISQMWINDARNRKCVISLKRMSRDEIYNMQPAPEIDPYSSLEEVFSSDNQDTDPVKLEPTYTDTEEKIIGSIVIKNEYYMRPRKEKNTRVSTRPKRLCRQDINYALLNSDGYSDNEIKSHKNKKSTRTLDSKSEPSEERTASQRFYSKDPSTMKPIQRHTLPGIPVKSKKEPDIYDGTTEDCDTSPENSDDKASSNISMDDATPTYPSSPNVKKGKLKIVVKGRRKHRVLRKYKCISCPAIRETRSGLNEHYRLHHPPVSCQACGKSFATPATLERHSYYHVLPMQFPCLHPGCDKLFPFTSDRAQHSLVHRTSHDWVCMYPKCKRRFLSKGSLTKHAKTHESVYYECDVCTYRDKDKRNVKAHEWSHVSGPGKHRYYCDHCQKGFTYYTQWQRHDSVKPKKCVSKSGSGSPEY